LALETAGILIGVALIGTLLGLNRSHMPRLTVAAVGALAAVLALSSVPSSVAYLNHERTSPVSARAGREYCAVETSAQAMLPFLRWAKAQMAPHDRYWLAPSPVLTDAPSGIDPLCVSLLMLPRLPLSSPTGAGWTMYIGGFTPALQSRIAAHDPSVHVYSRGLALVRDRSS
jgi:hypothetical protein